MINDTKIAKSWENLDFTVSIIVDMCTFSEKRLTYYIKAKT